VARRKRLTGIAFGWAWADFDLFGEGAIHQ